jgi:hypothetical protein
LPIAIGDELEKEINPPTVYREIAHLINNMLDNVVIVGASAPLESFKYQYPPDSHPDPDSR